ncbi:MAG: DNA-3-methyladenine glycosylase 2 family protein [Saprospiraceae bacterium]
MPISKSKVTRHLSTDPILQPLIKNIPFPLLETTPSPVSEALIESIVYQQLSIKAAAVIYKRLLDKFRDGKLDLIKLSRMKTESLRSVGLSYSKSDYVRNIARFFLEKENQGTDWHGMDEDELTRRLTLIKGVGNWTVQMIMISPMGKTDVFPALDLGVQQGIVNLYGLKETGKSLTQKMHEIAEPWRPYRSIACMYLWRWKDQFKKMKL